MASMYMMVDGMSIGDMGATVKGLPDGDWFSINSFSGASYRDIRMDVGEARNGDNGGMGISPMSITRSIDGVTAHLETYFFSPGGEGKDVVLCVTRPGRNTEGQVPVFMKFLTKARLSSHALDFVDGVGVEHLTLTFEEVETEYFHEKEGGDIITAGKTGFNLGTAVMTSGAK